jgi:tetratricopeptide (TPR) repeat protein
MILEFVQRALFTLIALLTTILAIQIFKNKENLKRLGLMVFGILLAFGMLELGLRIGNLIYTTTQQTRNLITGYAVSEGVYTILCLGESTTADFYGSSWPYELQKTLDKKNLTTKFRVINGGIGGANTAIILSKMEEYFERYEPQMVVSMMGINDKHINPVKLVYETTPQADLESFLSNFKIYKLFKLLSQAWLPKTNKTRIGKKDYIQIEQECTDCNNPKDYYFELIKNYLQLEDEQKAEETSEKLIQLDPTNIWIHKQLGWIYKKNNLYDFAEQMFEKAMYLQPNNPDISYELALIYRAKGKYQESEKIFLNLNEIHESIYNYKELGLVYLDWGKLEKSEEMFLKMIEMDPDNIGGYIFLGILYQRKGMPKKDIVEFYLKNGFVLNIQENTSTEEIIKYHYNVLFQLLKQRGIKYISMQYPLIEVDELRSLFDDAARQEIIFVSNKENFEEALEQFPYEYLFKDMFAGDFGHCTSEGNRLIAENLASVILKELNITN